MEALAPVASPPRMELLLNYVPAGGQVLACDPERIRAAGRRSGPHQPGVPRGVLGERGGGRPGADRPRGVRRFSRSPRCAPPRTTLGCPGGRLRRSMPPARTPPALAPVRSWPAPGASDGGADEAGHGFCVWPRIWRAIRAVPIASRCALGAAPAPAYRGDTSRALADVRDWLGEGLAGWCWSPRATARRSAWPRCSAVRGLRRTAR